MRLYYAPQTISIAIAIALEEAGLPYEAMPVDFKSGAQAKEPYLSLNPKGRVPTLETQDGSLLTETGAILEYIGTLAPQAGLVPADPIKAAHMRSTMYYLASTMHVNHAHKLRGHRWADDPASLKDMSAKVPQTMTDSARYLADHCLLGDFITGDTPSLADPYAYMVCSWLETDGVAMSDFPTIAAFLQRMTARASVQSVLAQGMLAA